MNRTGHYEWDAEQRTFVRTSDSARLEPHVYFNKGNHPQFDASARMTFESRQHKARWLKRWGLKEGGVIRKRDLDKSLNACQVSKV